MNFFKGKKVSNIFLMLLLFSGFVSAEPIFPRWPSVSVSQIKSPVPEFVWVGVPGSVQPKYKKRLSIGCPLRDFEGRVIGFSLSCQVQ